MVMAALLEVPVDDATLRVRRLWDVVVLCIYSNRDPAKYTTICNARQYTNSIGYCRMPTKTVTDSRPSDIRVIRV
jgi:hypothetical protein